MSLQDTLTPNEHKYIGSVKGKYLSSRLLTHNGITIAVALGKSAQTNELFFEYSVLNAADQETPDANTAPGKPNLSDAAEILDSQCWFENARPLRFSSEIRVVGEEAVPCFQIPAIDRTRRSVARDQTEKLDPWLSTSLGLMDPDVTHFELLSDGRYVYLFRQSRNESDTFPSEFGKTDTRTFDQKPPINSNLLCDRFNLVGTTLTRSLEVRYRRSRQKRLPLNDRDTLAVQDIDDVPFFEPTFSLRFVKSVGGIFSILQTPTMANGVSKWMIFILSGDSGEMECYTTDVSKDGLFDLHGQIYYTCDSEDHDEVFSSTPGTCTTIARGKGEVCGEAKTVIIPKAALSDRAISLYNKSANTDIKLNEPICLSGAKFSEGFTIEAWIAPVSFWVKDAGESSAPESDPATQRTSPPSGSAFCIFSQAAGEGETCPSVFIDNRLQLVLRVTGDTPILLSSGQFLEVDAWNHVAVTYTASTRSFSLILNGAMPLPASIYKLPVGHTVGNLTTVASQSGKFRFQGQLDELRLWRRPLHAATIKTKMSTRASGMEPLLEACWHFDEGTGTDANDATTNENDISFVQTDSTSPPESKLWRKSSAPILSNTGLSKIVLRTESDVRVRRGISACLYYEQVSTTQSTGSSPTESSKPLKRSARVLLCFIAFRPSLKEHLAVLDFALMSDGTLCDTPATLPLPAITLKPSRIVKGSQRGHVSQLFLDAQGMEIFGGILTFDAARAQLDSPCVWDSATGSISIFFTNSNNVFSALTYDISRSVELAKINGIAEGIDSLATTKLRQAITVDIETKSSAFAPETVAVDLVITATMHDNSKISEVWQGNLDFSTPKICFLTCLGRYPSGSRSFLQLDQWG
jgi:hypothetical protein